MKRTALLILLVSFFIAVPAALCAGPAGDRISSDSLRKADKRAEKSVAGLRDRLIRLINEDRPEDAGRICAETMLMAREGETLPFTRTEFISLMMWSHFYDVVLDYASGYREPRWQRVRFMESRSTGLLNAIGNMAEYKDNRAKLLRDLALKTDSVQSQFLDILTQWTINGRSGFDLSYQMKRIDDFRARYPDSSYGEFLSFYASNTTRVARDWSSGISAGPGALAVSGKFANHWRLGGGANLTFDFFHRNLYIGPGIRTFFAKIDNPAGIFDLGDDADGTWVKSMEYSFFLSGGYRMLNTGRLAVTPYVCGGSETFSYVNKGGYGKYAGFSSWTYGGGVLVDFNFDRSASWYSSKYGLRLRYCITGGGEYLPGLSTVTQCASIEFFILSPVFFRPENW